jgi:hypothetical protein
MKSYQLQRVNMHINKEIIFFSTQKVNKKIYFYDFI